MGDERDEETDGGMVERTGGGIVGGWSAKGCGSNSGGDEDGIVKSNGSDAGVPLEEKDIRLDILQDFSLCDGGDDNEEGKKAEDPAHFLAQTHQLQHLNDAQYGARDKKHVGHSTLPPTGRLCRQRPLPTWSNKFRHSISLTFA